MGLVFSYSDFSVKEGGGNLFFSLSEKKRHWENSISLQNIPYCSMDSSPSELQRNFLLMAGMQERGKEGNPPHSPCLTRSRSVRTTP